MELIDYGSVLRRWSVLIIAGTLVAALIGYRVALRSREAAHPHDVGTAGVVVHYVTPPSVASIPTLSLYTQTDVLSTRVYDPGALRRVAARARVTLSQVQHVSAAVDAQKPLITVQVVSTTPRAAAAVAQGLAEYLARVETQQVQAQAAILRRTAASAAAQARQRWLAAQTHYYLVCGCMAGQPQATADAVTLARLRAALDLLQGNYAAAAGRYAALQSNPVPVATVMAGSVSAVPAAAASPIKAVLLAAAVGLVVSGGLATLLDVRRNGLPALAGARRPAHGAGSHQVVAGSRRLVPRRPQLVKAVLLAATLGLVVCSGLAGYWLQATGYRLPVASHVAAGHGRLVQKRWPRAAAPPTLVLNPEAVHFKRQDGPTRRTAHTIHVVNVGPAPVTIRTITITGPDRDAFAESDTCTRGTVGAYGGCIISVHVAPMARRRRAGGETRTATLLITTKASANPLRVPLSA